MVSQSICSFCNHGNPDTASFCQRCGRVLAATTVQGRTVVMNGTPPPNMGTVPHFDAKTVIDRVTRAFGPAERCRQVPGTTSALPQNLEDMFLVCDVSTSMEGEMDNSVMKIEGLRRAAVNLVLNKYQIDRRDRIGIITFECQASLCVPLVPLGSCKHKLLKTIQSLVSFGGTNIENGIRLARDSFDWSCRDRIRRVVLLTDGHDSEAPTLIADEMKNRGVVIDTIGIGQSPNDVNEALLKRMASTIEGELRYRFIKDHQSLIKHFTHLATKTATQA